MTEELKRRMANKSEAYWEGYDANDKHRLQNPYQKFLGNIEYPADLRHQDWEDGWLTKFYGETI